MILRILSMFATESTVGDTCTGSLPRLAKACTFHAWQVGSSLFAELLTVAVLLLFTWGNPNLIDITCN